MQDAGRREEPISCLTETNIQRISSLNLPENATGRSPSSGNAKNEAGEVPRYPLRPSEPDCSYYLKTGFCKFGGRCRFNHPLEKRLQLDFGLRNGISSENKVGNFQTLKTTSYNCFPVLDASKPYAPAMSFSQWLDLYMDKSSCLHSRRISSSAKTTCSSSALNQNTIMKLVDASIHMKVTFDESLCESPGEHQSQNCMRYHPLQLQACHLSPVGLPLRPDQPLCKYYGRFGICNYGPACEFDHPVDDGNRNDESSQMSL